MAGVLSDGGNQRHLLPRTSQTTPEAGGACLNTVRNSGVPRTITSFAFFVARPSHPCWHETRPNLLSCFGLLTDVRLGPASLEKKRGLFISASPPRPHASRPALQGSSPCSSRACGRDVTRAQAFADNALANRVASVLENHSQTASQTLEDAMAEMERNWQRWLEAAGL
jgi:hypothetical protein